RVQDEPEPEVVNQRARTNRDQKHANCASGRPSFRRRRMFIVATHSNFENRSVGVRCFVGLRRYISLLRSLPRAFNTGAINIASLRDWIMIGLFGALCTVPAIAQRNGVRRPDTPNQTADDRLTSSAKNSLDAAVAALPSNALVEA